MPMQLLHVNIPKEVVSAEDARPYLKDFVYWLHDFLDQVRDIRYETDLSTGNPLFETSQISFINDALSEADKHFDNVLGLIERASAETLSSHGLEGVQLLWKLSNIKFWYERFIADRTAALLERLLSSVDALLKSLLGAVGAGDALEELKEAVLNSMALVTK